MNIVVLVEKSTNILTYEEATYMKQSGGGGGSQYNVEHLMGNSIIVFNVKC